MSLTQTNHIFAGVNETAINTVLKALLTARPHLIHYGSPAFVPVTTTMATSIPAIAFPGVPNGIQYEVQFSIPVFDLFPPNGPGPLPPGPGELNLRVDARITVDCLKWSGNSDNKRGMGIPLRTTLRVWAKGKPNVRNFGPGSGDIGFDLEAVKIPALAGVGGTPDTFEAVVECLVRMMLQGMLNGIRLPFNVLTVAFFKLILQRGPVIDANQIKLWGDIT